MTRPTTARDEIAFLGLACLVCAYAAIAHAALATSFLDLRAYMHGTAPTPFQYRILPILVLRPAVALSDAIGLGRLLAGRPAPFNDPVVAALLPLNLGCLVLLAWAARRRLLAAGAAPFQAAMLALGLPLVLLFNLALYVQGNYFLPYDVPGICFFFLVAMADPGKRMTLAWCVLGTLNRETVIFAAGICFLANLRRIPKEAALMFAAQCALWLLLKAGLWVAFRDNARVGAGLFDQTLWINLDYLSNPVWWPQVLSVAGFLWVPVLLRFGQVRDPVLRMAVLCFPGFLLIMLLTGRIVEMRIFAEYTPFFYLAAMTALLGRAAAAPGYDTQDWDLTRPTHAIPAGPVRPDREADPIFTL